MGAGVPEEKINARGQLSIWQRPRYLVDPGSWCPLHTLYNPEENDEGHTNVFDGLGRIREYLTAVAGAAYQNSKSICPQHQMTLPRIIKG